MSGSRFDNDFERDGSSADRDNTEVRSGNTEAGQDTGEETASAVAGQEHRGTSAGAEPGLADPREIEADVSGETEYVVVVTNGKRYSLPRSQYEAIIANIGPGIARRLALRRWEDKAAEAASQRSVSSGYREFTPAGQRNSA